MTAETVPNRTRQMLVRIPHPMTIGRLHRGLDELRRLGAPEHAFVEARYREIDRWEPVTEITAYWLEDPIE